MMGTPAVGVTGSIGTGKSTFCDFLAKEGGKHLNADNIAKDLMKPGHAGYDPVIDEFGTKITDEKGYVQPNRLAEEVFTDAEKLETLEGILHPLVARRIQRTIGEARHSFYVIDAPLLFEAGMDDICDWVVVVTAPDDVVNKRLKARGMTSEEIKQRRSRQMPEPEKMERADDVIHNDGALDELEQKADDLRSRILSR